MDLYGLTNETRHAVQDLLERASEVRTWHRDEPRRWAEKGPNLYLSWGEPRAAEGLEEQGFDPAPDPQPGADLLPFVRGPREVTLTVRCDSYSQDVIAEHVLERLSFALAADGWREELRALGFVFFEVLGRVTPIPMWADGKAVSSAGMQLGLRYASRYDDRAHLTTWIDQVVIHGIAKGASPTDPDAELETEVETEPATP